MTCVPGSKIPKEVELLIFEMGSLVFRIEDDDGADESETMALLSHEPTAHHTMQKWMLGYVPFDEPETLCRELKEFVVLTTTDSGVSGITEASIRHMFETSNFRPLLRLSTLRLEQMIDHYTPKYMTTFYNTGIKKAEFLIGLTDDGEVTGAIVPTCLTERDVRGMVMAKVEEIIQLQTDISPHFTPEMVRHYLPLVQDKLEVRLIEIQTDTMLLDDWSDDFLREHAAKIEEYRVSRQKYIQELREITNQIEFYRRAVEKMVNDPAIREEFSKFIRTHVPARMMGVATPELRKNLITRLYRTDDDPILYDVGQISDEKGDIRNMAYWITEFRDLRVEELRVQKPKMPNIPKPTPLYTSLMVRNPVHRMVKGIANDPNLKVVVIQIVFPGKTELPFFRGMNYHPSMSYIDPTGARKTSIRCINANGPSCV